MRELQGRLTSLDSDRSSRAASLPPSVEALFARQMFELQHLRDAMKGCRERQSQLFKSSSECATAIGPEMAEIVQRQIAPHFQNIFTRVADESGARSKRIAEDQLALRIESRLAPIEARFRQSIQEFAKLREDSIATERAVLKAGERLDALWENQDESGIGPWRRTVRDIAAAAGWESYEPRSPREHFLGESGEDKPSRPAIPNMSCPKCGAEEVRRLARDSFIEELLRLVAIAPYRCRDCGERFYRMRVRRK